MAEIANEIINIQMKINEESLAHLKQKALLTKQLGNLIAKEKLLENLIIKLKLQMDQGSVNLIANEDTSELVTERDTLSTKLNTLQADVLNLEKTVSLLELEKEDLEEKNIHLNQQREDYTSKIEKVEKIRSTSKKASMKVKSQQQRLSKLKNRYEEQLRIKDNLHSFLQCLATIEQVVASYSPLSNENSLKTKNLPMETTPDVVEKIMEANRSFIEAQTKFNPNSLTDFLLNADKAYQASVEALIRLSTTLPDSLLEEKFSHQVLTIVNSGLSLNTRHLNAVKTLIEKLESGLEISPLASFANELKEYFMNNLQLLRIPGASFSLD